MITSTLYVIRPQISGKREYTVLGTNLVLFFYHNCCSLEILNCLIKELLDKLLCVMNLLFNVYDSHTLYITLYQCSKCTMSFTDKKFVIETGTTCKYVSQSSNKHSN